MQIAIVGAGFTAGEADGLRRAMATFRHNGDIHRFREEVHRRHARQRLRAGFRRRAASSRSRASAITAFPQAHAASFALLVYVSAWLKCLHPEVFACALLNSQPMGFYAPAQIVRDAREHGVEVRPVDVNHSDWDCSLEPTSGARRALRLGFRQVKGLAEKELREKLVAARTAPYRWPAELQHKQRAWSRRARAAGAMPTPSARWASTGAQALWAVKGLPEAEELPLLAPLAGAVAGAAGGAAGDGLGRAGGRGLSRHRPLAEAPSVGAAAGRCLRRAASCPTRSCWRRRPAKLRQGRGPRPGAPAARRPPSGVIFMTLEDETGIANIVVWPKVFERFRPVVMGARLVEVTGRVQREGAVIHVVADRLADLSPLLRGLWDPGKTEAGELRVVSRDFR